MGIRRSIYIKDELVWDSVIKAADMEGRTAGNYLLNLHRLNTAIKRNTIEAPDKVVEKPTKEPVGQPKVVGKGPIEKPEENFGEVETKPAKKPAVETIAGLRGKIDSVVGLNKPFNPMPKKSDKKK